MVTMPADAQDGSTLNAVMSDAAAVTGGAAGSGNAQVMLILRSLFSRLPHVSNPFAGVNASTVGSQVKLEAMKLVEIKAYSRPATLNDALARFRANTKFFRLTYSFVVALIVLIYIISNASLFIAVGILGALWSWFLAQPADHVLQIGSVQLKRGEKLVGLVVVTVLMVVFGGLMSAIFWVALQSLLVVGTMASLREAVQLDALEELELENEKLVAVPAGNIV
jgi:hypothetical protein